MIRVALAVAAGGAVGSVLRFLASSWVAGNWPRHFYLGTFAVNLVGCLLIGLLWGCSSRVPIFHWSCARG